MASSTFVLGSIYSAGQTGNRSILQGQTFVDRLWPQSQVGHNLHIASADTEIVVNVAIGAFNETQSDTYFWRGDAH